MNEKSMLAMIAGLSAGFIVLLIVLVFIGLIATWRIFTKAGEPGWKSLIPLYNVYTLFKITWAAKWFWITFAISFCSAIIDKVRPANAGGFLAILMIVLGIAEIVIYVTYNLNLAKSFGKSAGFAIGLILLPFIFDLILGFGSAEYIGPKGEPEAKWA